MEHNEAAEPQSEDQEAVEENAAQAPPAPSYEPVLKGIVDVVYADEDKDFGFIAGKDQKFYFDPRFLAAEERPVRGDRCFFVARPPLKSNAQPVAGAVLTKGKPAVGSVVNVLPNGKSGFIQVADELGNHFNIYMPISTPLGEVSPGERFRFTARENADGPFAARPMRVE